MGSLICKSTSIKHKYLPAGSIVTRTRGVTICIKFHGKKKKSCFEHWRSVGCLKDILKYSYKTPEQQRTSPRKSVQRRMSPRKKDGERPVTCSTTSAISINLATMKTVRNHRQIAGGIKAQKRATAKLLSAGAGTPGKLSAMARLAGDNKESDC